MVFHFCDYIVRRFNRVESQHVSNNEEVITSIALCFSLQSLIALPAS